MKLIAAALAVALYASSAGAADDHPWRWTRSDVAYEAAYTALHVLDWGQTLDIARRPEFEETLNPVLGREPSVARVNAYMAATLVAHWGITAALPAPYRRPWQLLCLGWDGALVARNWRAGIQIRF